MSDFVYPSSFLGLTDTQLRASAVPVSGTLTVTNTGTFAVQPTANATVDLNKIAGTTTDVNSGNKSAGSQRVVIATDDINLAAINTSTSGMSAKLPATLGQKAMSASMSVTLASDQSALTVSEGARTISSTTLQNAATATGNGTSISVAGYNSVEFFVTGTFSAGITPETSYDGGTTWTSCLYKGVKSQSIPSYGQLTGSISGGYVAPVLGATHFRVRVSSYTSGSITVTGQPSASTMASMALVHTSQTWIGNTAISTGNGVVDGGTQRVAIASDNTPFFVKPTGADGSTLHSATNPIFARLTDGTAALIGQKAMAASLPVVIASDQSAISTTGTVTNAGTFAVQDSQVVTDNASFTDGTSKVFMAGYVYDEVADTALTENDAAAARVTANRSQVGVIEDGTTRGRYAGVNLDGSINVNVVNSAVTATIDMDGEALEVYGTVKTEARPALSSIVTSVPASTSTVTLVAGRMRRLGLSVYNDSTSIMYLQYGSTASTTSFSAAVPAGALYEMPPGINYPGPVSAVWGAASGNARITEFA